MGMMADVKYILAYFWEPAGVSQNIRFCQRAVDIGDWPCLRVFISDKWPGVLITPTDVQSCRDPHVLDWADTMYETTPGDILVRLAQIKD